MASACSFLKLKRRGRTTVALNDMDEIDCDQTVQVERFQSHMKYWTVSKIMVRSLSEMFIKNVRDRNKSSRCKVESFESLDMNCSTRLSSVDDNKPGKNRVKNAICLPEMPWRIGSRNSSRIELCSSTLSPLTSLPDEVLEMILTMLPWTSLMVARRVCRKWRCVCSTTHFMQRRSVGCFQRSCLLLFGITRSGFNGGEIHALDVSHDQWYSTTCNELKNRSMYSVVSIGNDVYIVGGYTSFTNSCNSLDRTCNKSLKDVLVFNPIKGLFHKATSMKEARAEPILGVFEITSSSNIFLDKIQRNADRNSHENEGHLVISSKCELSDVLHGKDYNRNLSNHTNYRIGQSRCALISVGGRGSWDEPLDTAEIYDPLTNKWVEISRLPAAFGPVCSGTVFNYMFYVYSETDKLAAFDLTKGCWVMILVRCTPPRLPDYSPKLVFCGARLFMLCVSWCERNGLLSRRPKAVRNMWELDLNSYSWSEVSRHPDAPMDCNASFVADQNMIYGVEMFRIFGQVLDFVTACNVSGSVINWKRVSRKHAAHEADSSSCITKSMLVMNL